MDARQRQIRTRKHSLTPLKTYCSGDELGRTEGARATNDEMGDSARLKQKHTLREPYSRSMGESRAYMGAVPPEGILCHLCRSSTVLTRAHVPPQCAGNKGTVVRMRPYAKHLAILHDSPKQGGLWLKTLCHQCNNIASKYDAAYKDLSNRLRIACRPSFALLGKSPVPPVSVAPGHVARSVLHGVVALAPSMNLVHQELLEDLLRDEEVRLPVGLQLRVARISGPTAG